MLLVLLGYLKLSNVLTSFSGLGSLSSPPDRIKPQIQRLILHGHMAFTPRAKIRDSVPQGADRRMICFELLGSASFLLLWGISWVCRCPAGADLVLDDESVNDLFPFTSPTSATSPAGSYWLFHESLPIWIVVWTTGLFALIRCLKAGTVGCIQMEFISISQTVLGNGWFQLVQGAREHPSPFHPHLSLLTGTSGLCRKMERVGIEKWSV